MPNYKGHLVGGAGAYLLVLLPLAFYSAAPSIFKMIEWLALSLLGALFPDIDTKSKGQRLFYSMLFVVLIYLFITQQFTMIAYLSFVALLPLLVHHRGLFHRVWFLLFICGVIILYTAFTLPTLTKSVAWDVLFFATGAISHIWLDFGFKRMLKRF